MRPPPRKDEARTSPESEPGRASNRASNNTRFAVVAVANGTRIVVGRCATIEEAEAQAVKHRRFIGITGTRIVIEHEDEPEFGTSRRGFLIAMFMLGAVPTERVVERVVAEIRRDEGVHV